MVAQLPFQVDAVLVTAVLRVRTAQQVGERATGARRDQTTDSRRASIHDDRTAASRLANTTVVLVADARSGDAVVGARRLAVTGQHRQGEVVGQIAGVLGDVRLATELAVVGATIRAKAWVRLVVRVRERIEVICLDLALVRQRGELEDVVVADVPVHLQQPLRLAIGGRRAVGLAFARERIVVELGIFDEAVGEQAVLDQRAPCPYGGREVVATGIAAVVDQQHAIVAVLVRQRLGERIGRPEDVAARVELVGAALGDLVDHATGRTAEFRTVTARLHLLLGDRLERHLREVQVRESIGDVEAVEVVLVLSDRRTTERSQVAERRVAAHRARRQQRNRGRVARHRDLRDLLGGQDRGRLHRRHVDRVDRARADHRHGVQRGGVATREIDVRSATDVHGHVAGGRAIPADLVLAGRQLRETVAAVRTHRDRAAETRRRVADGDGVARRRAAGHRTRGVRLGLHAAHERQTESNGQRATLQAFGNVIRSHCV